MTYRLYGENWRFFMLNIMEVNNSITRVINDNSEENLKEAISHLRRALCKHRYLVHATYKSYTMLISFYTLKLLEILFQGHFILIVTTVVVMNHCY